MIVKFQFTFKNLGYNPTDMVFERFCDGMLDTKLLIPSRYGDPYGGVFTTYFESDIEYVTDNYSMYASYGKVEGIKLYASMPLKDNHVALLQEIQGAGQPFQGNIIKFYAGNIQLTGMVYGIEPNQTTHRDAQLNYLGKIVPRGADCTVIKVKEVSLSERDGCDSGMGHEYVNVSAIFLTMACKRCGKDMPPKSIA